MNPEASKARRCLFGRPDHEQVQADLQKELNEDLQEMKEKWDFDFQKGKPLEGNKYEWVAVEVSKEESMETEGSYGAKMENKAEIKENSEDLKRDTQHFKTPIKNLR